VHLRDGVLAKLSLAQRVRILRNAGWRNREDLPLRLETWLKKPTAVLCEFKRFLASFRNFAFLFIAYRYI
jgi:hypothetical protein